MIIRDAQRCSKMLNDAQCIMMAKDAQNFQINHTRMWIIMPLPDNKQ